MIDALLFAGVVLALVFFGSAGLGFVAGILALLVCFLIHVISPFFWNDKDDIAKSVWIAIGSFIGLVAFSAAFWVVWQVITRLWDVFWGAL